MRTLTLNIIKGYGLDPVLNVSQFDKGYTVTATVQKGAEAFTPPTGSTATVEGRKPDNTGYQYPATIDGSTVTFTMAEQMTVLPGRAMAEIVFYNADSVRIGTANFYIIVEAAPLNEKTVISDTELPAIIDAANANAERAEDAADEAEATLANFAAVVAEQVEQMQIHEGQTVIDGTLTVSGAAADAKTTGEMVRAAVDAIGAFATDTASGAVATFTDDKGGLPLKSLVVDIEMVQSGSGDPSPTNVRPISGWDAVITTREGEGGANRQTYTTNLPATVYGGTLDVVTGKLIVEYAKYNITEFAGAFGTSTNGYAAYVLINDTSHEITTIDPSQMKSNRFTYNQNGRQNMPLYGYGGNNGTSNVHTFILPPTVTSVADANAWLADNPTECTLRLATPLEYDLTPQEVTTLLGSNSIYADCGDIENAEYLIDTKEYVDSQRVAIDDTLSVSGEAADAKATGDKFSTAMQQLPDIRENTDLNTLIDVGYRMLYTNYTYTNAPDGYSGAGWLFTFASNNVLQFFQVLIVNKTGQMYYRRVGTAGGVTTYHPWITLYDSDALLYKDLAGKKLSIVGDSISTYSGYVPTGYSSYYPTGDLNSVNKTWWKQVIDKSGMTLLVNASWSGSWVCYDSSVSADSAKVAYTDARINAIGSGTDNPDIIIVLIGTNDFIHNNGAPLGTFDINSELPGEATPITEFKPAYATMIDKIRTKYPDAHVYCCTLIERYRGTDSVYPIKNGNGVSLAAYNQAIEEIAHWMGCRVIRLDTVISLGQIPNMTVDGTLHPNAAGAQLIANYVLTTLAREEKAFI